MACRGYVLTVGNDDISADPYLVKVRSAAASAGSTAGLSDNDFARFRAVVEKIDALTAQQKILDDGTTTGLPVTTLARLSKAVTAVHALCY